MSGYNPIISDYELRLAGYGPDMEDLSDEQYEYIQMWDDLTEERFFSTLDYDPWVDMYWTYS